MLYSQLINFINSKLWQAAEFSPSATQLPAVFSKMKHFNWALYFLWPIFSNPKSRCIGTASCQPRHLRTGAGITYGYCWAMCPFIQYLHPALLLLFILSVIYNTGKLSESQFILPAREDQVVLSYNVQKISKEKLTTKAI